MERMDVNLNGIQEHLKKLKESEEEELTEIRRKRLAEEEKAKSEMDKRNEEEHLRELKEKEESLRGILRERRRRYFRLEMEASSWDRVATVKSDELKTAERTLSDGFDRVWRAREGFCSDVDVLLGDLRNFARDAEDLLSSKQWNGNLTRDVEREITHLEKCVAEQEETLKGLDERLSELAEEEKLLMESASAQLERSFERGATAMDGCSRAERRFPRSHAEGEMSQRTEAKSKLFSIVTVEEVRRLSNPGRERDRESLGGDAKTNTKIKKCSK